MTTILQSIEEKYSYDDAEDYGFIVYISNSPETKKGMFPPILTLCDFDIRFVGTAGISSNRLTHIAELDLTDNIICDWSEVFLLFKMFPGLDFLNLSNNMLNDPLTDGDRANLEEISSGPSSRRNANLRMRKFVLNGNRVDWNTVDTLIAKMPHLDELHMTSNNLQSPSEGEKFEHKNVRHIFLGCNPIQDFDALSERLGAFCPSLEQLSLAECPINSVPECGRWPNLHNLNLSTTKIGEWPQVDKLRVFPKLRELRLQHCPVLNGFTAHERRIQLVARLPKVLILNGGDKITNTEREDSERAFIRFYNEADSRPSRYDELVSVHGHLDPLVNVNMRPDTHVKVNIVHKEESREEVIKVYQTVQQFKALLQQWFGVAPQNMKLYYCDKVLLLYIYCICSTTNLINFFFVLLLGSG